MAKKKQRESRSKPPEPRRYGEVWLLPGHPILFPGQPSSDHPILLLQDPDSLNDLLVDRLLFAPISSSPMMGPWDFPIRISQHDHCLLTKDCCVVLSCIQPMLKEDLESNAALYRGYLEPESMEEIARIILLQLGISLL